jgi:type IV pilus assembly protein PilW
MSRRAQSGLSMIEMMVSIVLALLVTQAAVSLFLANRYTSNTTAGVAAATDNGRFALDFIGQAIRGSGYMACNAINNKHQLPSSPVDTDTYQSDVVPAVPPTIYSVLNNYLQAFSGAEAANTEPGDAIVLTAPPVAPSGNHSHWINAGGLDAVLFNAPGPPNGPGGAVEGSDVLVVREVLPNTPDLYLSAQYNPGATLLQLQSAASLTGTVLPANAVISNCSYSVAFQITGFNAATGQVTTNAALGPIAFAQYSSVALIDTAAYFVGPGRDGDSSLWVYHDSTNSYTELVPDIENMQVMYGFAPSTPTLATQYVTADVIPNTLLNAVYPADFNQVVSVRIAVLAASPPNAPGAVTVPAVAPTYSLLGTTVTAPIDNRMRQMFDVTIVARDATQ